MRLNQLIVMLFAVFALSAAAYAQVTTVPSDHGRFSVSELRNNASDVKTGRQAYGFEEAEQKSSKSTALAILYSLLVPGTGHWYLDRMDVGKYFVGVEAAALTGLIAMNVHGDNVADDAKSYSVQHAQVTDPGGRDEDFFVNVGNYNNVYEYNNDKLARGEYSLLYDANTQFWNWDSENNRFIFETQRRDSEEIYNNRIIFGSIMIANRVVSAISAFLIAKDTGKKKVSIEPVIYGNRKNSVDGFGMSFQHNF